MGNIVSHILPAKEKRACIDGNAAAQGSAQCTSGNSQERVGSTVNRNASYSENTNKSSELNFESNSSSLSDALMMCALKNALQTQKSPTRQQQQQQQQQQQHQHQQHHHQQQPQHYHHHHTPVPQPHMQLTDNNRSNNSRAMQRNSASAHVVTSDAYKHAIANKQRYNNNSNLNFAQLKAMRTKQRMEFARAVDKNRMQHMRESEEVVEEVMEDNSRKSRSPPKASSPLATIQSMSPRKLSPKRITKMARKAAAAKKGATAEKNAKFRKTAKKPEFKPRKPLTRADAKRLLKAQEGEDQQKRQLPAKNVKNCVAPRQSSEQSTTTRKRSLRKTNEIDEIDASPLTDSRLKAKGRANARKKPTVVTPASAPAVPEQMKDNYMPAFMNSQNEQQLQQRANMRQPRQRRRSSHEREQEDSGSYDLTSSSSVSMSELLVLLEGGTNDRLKAHEKAAHEAALNIARQANAAAAAAAEVAGGKADENKSSDYDELLSSASSSSVSLTEILSKFQQDKIDTKRSPVDRSLPVETYMHERFPFVTSVDDYDNIFRGACCCGTNNDHHSMNDLLRKQNLNKYAPPNNELDGKQQTNKDAEDAREDEDQDNDVDDEDDEDDDEDDDDEDDDDADEDDL